MTITNFTALHDAMEGHFKLTIPSLKTVDAYRDKPDDKIKTPAVLVGVDEMQTAKKLTGGRLAMTCVFNAYCILSTSTARAELEVRNMAALVAMKLDGERFGLGEAVGRPANITAVPGVFENDQPGLECWIVSWEQTVHLGDVWSPPDIVNDGVIGTGPKVDGFYLAGCHEQNHKLEDFPE